jgi:hypothetical protein
MAVLKNFDLVVGRNLVPLSDVIKITGLIGLEAFFIMETKERAVLLLKVVGKQNQDWCSFLAVKRQALVKSLAPAAGLNFCFLPVHSRARVPGGKASGLTFKAAISTTGAIAFQRE